MTYQKFIKSKLYTRKSNNLTLLGFDFNQDPQKEYYKTQSLLVSEYQIKCESMLTIMKKFNIPSSRTMDIVFRLFDITSRNLSEAQSNAITERRSNPQSNPTYKMTWHTSWNNKKVFLRSSYELNYARVLDEKFIDYEVEGLRIKYFDSAENKFRIAIPDFYLPESNTIVEIKSKYWLNEENMKNKKDEYKRLGFNFILVVDGVQYNW